LVRCCRFINLVQSSVTGIYHARGQKNMTTPTSIPSKGECPAESLLKLLAGKWKARIFRLAAESPLRFNTLLRQIPGASRQSIATALKELEQEGLLHKRIISSKPLHIEYILSERGQTLLPVFYQLEGISDT